MKKIAMVMAAVFMTAGFAYGEDNAVLAAREKFLAESTAVKGIMQASKDAVLVNSMYDACVLTVTQLDAYFYMAGVYKSIPEGAPTVAAIDYLTQWLASIKKANTVSIASLDAITYDVSPETAAHIKTLKGLYADLNAKIDGEIDKLGILAKASPPEKRAAQQKTK